MPTPIDRPGLVLLVAALLGPFLLAFIDFTKLKTSTAANSELGGAAPGAPSSTPPLPKLDTVALVSPKVKVKARTRSDSANFPVNLQFSQNWTTKGGPLYVNGEWLPHSGGSAIPLTWTQAPVEIKPGDFRIVPATIKNVLAPDLGSGVLRVFTCPDSGTPTPSRCGAATSNLELTTEVTPVPTNTALLYWPLIYAVVCLVIATVVIATQSELKSEALATGPIHWRVGNSWAANLNAGAAIVGSFAAIGLQGSSFGSITTPKEYAAWIAIYVLCTALAPTVFGLLKVAKRPDGSKPPEDAGTFAGFYVANTINLTGMGGQLMLSWFGFQALKTENILAPCAADVLSFVPVLLALATMWYVVQRFLLICAPHIAQPPDSELGGSAAPGATRML